MARRRVSIDHSVGPQPYLSIAEAIDPTSGTFKYTIQVDGPDGSPPLFNPPLRIDDPLDAQSIAFATAQAMARLPELAYGYTKKPYFWRVNRWTSADNWLKALSNSMNGLIRTGLMLGASSRCFYNQVHAAWLATSQSTLELKSFGRCNGIPVDDMVIEIGPSGDFSLQPHSSTNQNLHVLPVQAEDVRAAFFEFDSEQRQNSMLSRFLHSSLDMDQLRTLRRWFGLHLTIHQVGNPHLMLYMFGSGGNGKGVVLELLRVLLTEGAVASLRLSDLKTPANLELLVGKLAMLGAETTPETDNETLKTIVAGEPIVVNPKYRDPFDVRFECLVTQASNPAPHFEDDSDAMVRRVVALNMTHQPGKDDKVVELAKEIEKHEYPLLVAFALHGALEVIRDGTMVVPDSIASLSAQVVRPIRSVDRFMEHLEFGGYEIAEDELYAAYQIDCKNQSLKLSPRAEFLADLVVRLERRGTVFRRRAKATHYKPQSYINARNEEVLLVPQLRAGKSTAILLGLRIASGPFGPPIGQPIPEIRRDVGELFGVDAAPASEQVSEAT